jgi:tRNA wybutosine-synthesizing protein 4
VGNEMTDGEQPVLSPAKKKSMKKQQKPKAVQGTNDDATVSKRSAARQRYYDDIYVPPFVRRASRRSPLINRGYWLRVHMFRDAMVKWIQRKRDENEKVQIVSLGCGFDTSYWVLRRDNVLLDSDRYVEVDFDGVVARKSAIVARNSLLSSVIGKRIEDLGSDFDERVQRALNIDNNCKDGAMASQSSSSSSSMSVELHSADNVYHLLPVDLRSLDQLDSRLMPLLDASVPTLFVAECVMQYMQADDSSALVQWTRRSFESCSFLSFDQIRPDDAFGRRMCARLADRSSSLLGMAQFPDLGEHRQRYIDAGFDAECVENVDMLDYWSHHLDEPLRERIEALEVFDEIEDWHDTCFHYLFSFAHSDSSFRYFAAGGERASSSAPAGGDEPSNAAAELRYADLSERGAAMQHMWSHSCVLVDDESLLVAFGGFGGSGKHMRSSELWLFDGATLRSVADADVFGTAPSPRQYHAAAAFADASSPGATNMLVFGGRSSPSTPLGDVHMLRVRRRAAGAGFDLQWLPMPAALGGGGGDNVQPSPRWRHTMTAVQSSDGARQYVLLVGGRQSLERTAGDAFVFDVAEARWRAIEFAGAARFSHAAARLDANRVLISGGVADDLHTVLDDVWLFDADALAFTRCAGSSGEPRACHQMVAIAADRALLVGGLAPANNRVDELRIDVAAAAVASARRVPTPGLPAELRLLKHSAVYSHSKQALIVLCGGVSCFSFGPYFNPAMFALGRDVELLSTEPSRLPPSASSSSSSLPSSPLPSSSPSLSVATATVKTEADFLRVYGTRLPTLLKSVDMGSAVRLWRDADYLKRALGADRKASVHVLAERNMRFAQGRNFEFEVMPFGDFLDRVFAPNDGGGKRRYYFRSIGDNPRRETSNFFKSFPELVNDFSVPQSMRSTLLDDKRFFSCAFRISSADCRLWTHFDMRDNVLFEIVGRKRVVMFPPHQVDNLYARGSTSAVTDIDSPDLGKYPRFAEAKRHMIEFILEPGDALVIPALWWHNVLALDGPCIAINVFFNHLGADQYPTKDLYGNRDVLPAQRAFDSFDEMCAHLRSMPRVYADFYARVIAQRLQSSFRLDL